MSDRVHIDGGYCGPGDPDDSDDQRSELLEWAAWREFQAKRERDCEPYGLAPVDAFYAGWRAALSSDGLIKASEEAAKLREIILSTARASQEHGEPIHRHVLSPWLRALSRIEDSLSMEPGEK